MPWHDPVHHQKKESFIFRLLSNPMILPINHNLGKMLETAIAKARSTGLNYNIVISRPNKDGKYELAAGSTYEMMVDTTYADAVKRCLPMVLLHTTNELIVAEMGPIAVQSASEEAGVQQDVPAESKKRKAKESYISHNGHYLSLKTTSHDARLSYYAELADELIAWARENRIAIDATNIMAEKAVNHPRRHCTTIFVELKKKGDITQGESAYNNLDNVLHENNCIE